MTPMRHFVFSNYYQSIKEVHMGKRHYLLELVLQAMGRRVDQEMPTRQIEDELREFGEMLKDAGDIDFARSTVHVRLQKMARRLPAEGSTRAVREYMDQLVGFFNR